MYAKFLLYCANLCHQIAIGLLVLQLYKTKNGRGISVKTQELRLLVFVTRYLDLFTIFSNNLYNTATKICYIGITASIVIAIKYTEPFKSVYNFEQDSFPHWKFCVVPCALLALLSWDNEYNFHSRMQQGFFYNFSIYLEAVAILPQLMVLRRYRLVENLTGSFVFFLGLYRFLYVLFWTLNYSRDYILSFALPKVIAGCIQTLLYLSFFYEYARASRLFRSCSRRSDHTTNDGNGESHEDGLVFELSYGRGTDPSNKDARSTVEPLLLVLADVDGTSPDDLRRRTQDDSNAPARRKLDP